MKVNKEKFAQAVAAKGIPVAEQALADHMTLYIHECWTEKEIEDTVKALEKVEKVYLK